MEEELHYEGEFPPGQDGAEGHVQPSATGDAEEAEHGTEDGPSRALSGAPSRELSPRGSPGKDDGKAGCSGSRTSVERPMEEEETEQQQQQQSSRNTGGRSEPYGTGGGPGGRRTQHRVLISNLDASVQWQDLKDFGRKVGEVNYANVIFSGGKKYGVLEYCEEGSMEAAIRELDGARLRSSYVLIKKDRGDFEALVSSAPPRWAAEGGPRAARQPPRAPLNPSRGPPPGRWPPPGPLLSSPDMRMRDRLPPDMPPGPLRGPPDYSRGGGMPPPLIRGGRGGGPLVLPPGEGVQPPLRGGPGERQHQQLGPLIPPSRGSRGIPVDDDVFMSRRVHLPGRGRAPEPSRGPRRSRSPSPSWRTPPVHAGYRELTGKEGFGGGGSRIAIYEPPTAWRPSPRDASRREYSSRDGGIPYANGGAGEVGGMEEPPHKHSGFHGGPLREAERTSPPPPLPFSRGAGAPAADPLPSSGPSRSGWERGPRRASSPRRSSRGPASFVEGGIAASRGYGGEGRSPSRSRDRRQYGEAKRRRGSPPAGEMLMCMFGGPPQTAPADGDWRTRAPGGDVPLTNEGGPLPADTRRRQRSRSPRGGREAPYPAPHVQLVQEGRHIGGAPGLAGGVAVPQAIPPRSSRDRREDLPSRSAGGGGASHRPQDSYTAWGGTRRDDGWGERGPPPPEPVQQQFGGPLHRRGDSPPIRRRHMGPSDGAPPEARFVGSFGELRGRPDPSGGGPPSAHLPRGPAGATEERRGGGGWGYRPPGGNGALGPPPSFRGGPVSRRDAPGPPMNRLPQGQREPFGQLPYRP